MPDKTRGAGLKVLVIDDEEQIRTAIRSVLEARGFDVVLAETGQAGLDAAVECSPGYRARTRCPRRPFATMQSCARQAERCTSGGDQSSAGRQRRERGHHDASSVSIGWPNKAATFFWRSMIASARSKRCVRRLLSRSKRAWSRNRNGCITRFWIRSRMN